MKTNQLVKVIEILELEVDFDYMWIGEEEYEVLSARYDWELVLSAYPDRFGDWVMHESVFDKLDSDKRNCLLNAFIEYAHTPLDQRKEETRYIFPLPGLKTTDGEQQYLTQVGRYWFACRRKKSLRQTWKEEHIKWVPELYRKFKTEVKE